MEQDRIITIEDDVPILETRGRPTSPEYATLVKMPVGTSFTSHKTRDSLYQIARNLGFRVKVLWAGKKDGWRVWKMGPRIIKPALEPSFVPRAKKRKRGRTLAK